MGGGSSAGVIGRLEAGEPPARVAGALGLGPGAVLAAVIADALGEGDALGPPLTRVAPRRPRLAPALSEPALAELYPHAARPARLALAAGLLQIHDFWAASHEAAQEAGDLGEPGVSAYWHAIAHRREPDPGNAAYWFRRVGRHDAFGPLAAAARGLAAGDATPAGGLFTRDAWDPFAFIELCTHAEGEHAALARRLQRLEMLLLLEASLPT